MGGSNGFRGQVAEVGRRAFGGRSISALLSEIAREVGRGGFGVVYEARDLSLGRTVAFKVVSGGQGAIREDRLLREAAAAARLCHPNIVQLHDLGHSDYGPYPVLELLRGRTLCDRLATGVLPPREVLHLVYVPPAVYVFQPWADVLAAEELARLGRRDEARTRVAAFLESWSGADPDLPLLARARGLEQRLSRR